MVDNCVLPEPPFCVEFCVLWLAVSPSTFCVIDEPVCPVWIAACELFAPTDVVVLLTPIVCATELPVLEVWVADCELYSVYAWVSLMVCVAELVLLPVWVIVCVPLVELSV